MMGEVEKKDDILPTPHDSDRDIFKRNRGAAIGGGGGATAGAVIGGALGGPLGAAAGAAIGGAFGAYAGAKRDERVNKEK